MNEVINAISTVGFPIFYVYNDLSESDKAAKRNHKSNN